MDTTHVVNRPNRIQRLVRKRLDEQQHTMRWLADELQISRSYLSMLLKGDRRMSLAMAVQLEQKTGVSLREFAKVA